MESISGKIAAVTGGTRGIGRAIVERLLQEGAAVASCRQTKQAVECASSELRRKGRTFGCASDVSRPEGARAFFQAVDSAAAPSSSSALKSISEIAGLTS